MTKPTPVLAETIDRLSVRRAAVASELATLDEAISALQRIRISEPPAPPAPAPRLDLRHQDSPAPAPQALAAVTKDMLAGPALCALTTCRKPLPPPVRASGRPRQFCNDRCADQARKNASRPAGAVDDEDPTDRAIRLHKELNPLPESGTAYRGRGRAR